MASVEDLTNKRFAMITFAVEVIALFLALLSGSWLFVLVCLLFALATVMLWKYGYILVPGLILRSKIVEVRDKYEIPPSQDVVLKKVGNKYYASSFLLARVNESVTDRPESAKSAMEYFEKAITSVKHVTKFSVLIYNIDLDRYVDRIKAARSKAETGKSQLAAAPQGPNQLADMARLDREIAMYTKQLERVSTGERPMSVLSYIMTTASSGNREEAMERARNQAVEMKSVIASALDVDVIPLFGEDMKKCFEWEFTLPDEREFSELKF